MNSLDDERRDPSPTGDIPTYVVVYDEHCELCRRCRDWLSVQPSYVRLVLLGAGSVEARQRYGGLPWLGQELVVVGPDGNVWVGPAAFIVALWTTRRYRAWSFRLSVPAWAPMAERFFHAVSSKRRRLGGMMRSPECEWCERPPDREEGWGCALPPAPGVRR